MQKELQELLGDQWKDSVYCVVTDGAKNVTKASKSIGVSRRCLQHCLQLMLKWFILSIPEVATAVAAANYLAKLSGLSQKFRGQVGRIRTATPTRWNSYLVAANDVVLHKSKIIRYYESLSPAESAKMSPHMTVLRHKGFDMLHDLCSLLAPLMALAIDEEGEKYITSSSAIPRLIEAKKGIDTVMAEAEADRTGNGLIIRPKVVNGWKSTVDSLWNVYVADFLEDPIFLVATILDVRFCLGVTLPAQLRAKAFVELKTMLEKEFSRRVAMEIANARDAQHPASGMNGNGQNNNAGVQVANARTSAMPGTSTDLTALRKWISNNVSIPDDDGGFDFNSVNEEMAKFTATVMRLFEPHHQEHPNAKTDPLSFFRHHPTGKSLQLCAKVARDVFAVPVGEAPSERIFSIASRIHRRKRGKMSATHVAKATYVKKNRRALAKIDT